MKNDQPPQKNVALPTYSSFHENDGFTEIIKEKPCITLPEILNGTQFGGGGGCFSLLSVDTKYVSEDLTPGHNHVDFLYCENLCFCLHPRFDLSFSLCKSQLNLPGALWTVDCLL